MDTNETVEIIFPLNVRHNRKIYAPNIIFCTMYHMVMKCIASIFSLSPRVCIGMYIAAN